MGETQPGVLVVHNDDREASALRVLLERSLGCKTAVTWSGLEALKLLDAGHFNTLLTDEYVPDLYVGDLIERASSLLFPPRVFVVRKSSSSDAMGHYHNLGLCTLLDRSRPQTILESIRASVISGGTRRPFVVKPHSATSPEAAAQHKN